MRINFDFTDLHTFLAVAELSSFQRAAEALNVSQSAVTRRIQKLEACLGVTLFERTTRSLKLTLAARQFHERAKAIIDNAEDAIIAVVDDASRFEYYRNEVMTIATIQTVTHEILPSLIKSFRALGYTTRIKILDLFANDVVDVVSQGEADFGITFMGAEEPGLTFHTLAEDKFVVVMHRDNVLCEQSDVRVSDLEGHSVAIPWKGSGNRMLVDNALSVGNQTLDWTYQVRHSSSLLSLVESNIAVAILPLSAIPIRKESIIISRPLVDPQVSRAIGLVRRRGQKLISSAEAFHQLFCDHYQNIYQ